MQKVTFLSERDVFFWMSKELSGWAGCAGWLYGWLAGLVAELLAGWLAVCLAGCLIGWLVVFHVFSRILRFFTYFMGWECLWARLGGALIVWASKKWLGANEKLATLSRICRVCFYKRDCL